MKIRNVIHKGLRRFIETDDASGLPAPYVSKIGKIVSFLQDMTRAEELRAIPSWKAHRRPEGGLEPVRQPELAAHVSHRQRPARDHRPGL
jgi:plasmid maintenance system killer protein